MLPFFAKLPSCLVGIEACGTSHHWARELIKLGHEVRLMPPAYVKPYGAPRRRVLPVEEGSTQRVVD
jgi:transposase